MAIVRFLRRRQWVSIGASIILGLILLTAGLGKILNPGQPVGIAFNPFSGFLATYLDQIVHVNLPRVEVLVGALLLFGIAARLMAAVAGAMTLGYAANNAFLLSQGRGYEPCSCLGAIDRLIGAQLSTRGSLTIDIIMLILALVIIPGYRQDFLDMNPWFVRSKAPKDS